MRCVFIIPPHVQFKQYINPSFNERRVLKRDGNYYANLVTDMPLGPMCLSSWLKKHISDISVDLIDLNIHLNDLENFPYQSYYEFFQHNSVVFDSNLSDGQGIVFCISALFSPSYAGVVELANALRNNFPEAVIIAGGNIPSNMFKQIFSDTDSFDAVCYGEGELPLLELFQGDDPTSVFENSDSWITPQKVGTGFLPKQNFIWDLDDIPIADYDLCGDKYFENAAFSRYGRLNNQLRGFHIMSSRGCPFRCIFCASHKVHGRKMRYYSVERMEEEFRLLKEKYGANVLIFQDDHLMGDKKRAQKLIKYVGKLGLKAVFQNSLTLYALDRPMLETIKSAGVDELVLSIESGNERVLKEVMKKPLKLRIVEQVARDCRELDIYTYANILIGLPGETKEDIEATRYFLRTIYADWFSIFCANPLVGSEMHEICEENGYLDENWIGSDFKQAVVATEQWDSKYISDMSYLLNLELNFKYNSNIRLGLYEAALIGIKKAINAKDDHVIGHYYAAMCYKKLDDSLSQLYHLRKVKEFYSSAQWARWIDALEIRDQINKELQNIDNLPPEAESCTNLSADTCHILDRSSYLSSFQA